MKFYKKLMEKISINYSTLKRVSNSIKRSKLIRRGIDASGGPKNIKVVKKPISEASLMFGGVNRVVKTPFSGKVYINKGETMKAQLSSFYKKQIDMYDDDFLFKIRSKSLSKLDPKKTEALNRVGIIHEIQEAKITPKNVIGITSHGSPKVLFDEHNMVKSLKDKDIRNAMYNARASSGDLDNLKALLGKDFRYGKSSKIPKAMKKFMLKKYEGAAGYTRDELIKLTKTVY